MQNKKILIVIPAFNEERNITKIIREVQALDLDCCVLVVDDGSTDRTAFLASKAGAQAVSLPFNVGVGGAVQTGLRMAVKNEYDIVIRVDSDGQHDPDFIPVLLNVLINDEADLVIGSRFLPPHLGYQSSVIRRVGIHFFSHLISFLAGIKVTDPTSGFLGFNRKTMEAFAKSYPYDFPEPETIVIAKRKAMRIIEVPVQMRERRAGHSSIRYLVTLYYMIKVTFAILLNMIKHKERL